MERISFFGAVLLLSRLIQGSDAAGPPQFVQEGHDVLLQVDEARVPQKFTLLLWRFNGTRNLVSFQTGKEGEVFESYSGRVEISEDKFSVRLKNVTAADSGVYSTQLIRHKTETLSEHDVRVEAVVSPVHLQVASVSDSCNVNVTCCTITHCSTFTCHNDTCRREGGQGSEVTPTGASLHVYPSNRSIFCNHSNHVSWKITETSCSQRIDPPSPQRFVIYIVVSLFLILLVVVAAVFCHHRRGQYDRQNVENNVENTVYAVCEAEKTEPPEQLDAPPTTYSFVGLGSRSSGRKTRDESLPESLYAKVGKTERC
ncbi:SLAM family member 9-like [Embiotoca jacksoni]|uniref:SLAM family member 9-like n=1 Tax=Embiotoca jacksoni TaxID=100190 RepID=UPI00370495C0